jgi:UDP-glucose 4-epimerase
VKIILMVKKVLVAGGSGLVGSYLVDAMLEDGGYEIIVLGRNEKHNWQHNSVQYLDINLKEDWDEGQLPSNLYAIVHLSQAENFREFPLKAKEVFYINTLSTVKLINFAAKEKISHFVYASSGGIYGSGNEAFNELSPVGYNARSNFYITTKHCSEVVLENYFDQLNVLLFRFFFVYGRHQRKEMLIPRLIHSVKNDLPINLQGTNGLKINPIYARDAALAVLAGLQIQKSSTFNIGGPEILSLREICEIIGKAIGKQPRFESDEEKIPSHLIGDISRMKELLYTPTIKFKEIIKSLI